MARSSLLMCLMPPLPLLCVCTLPPSCTLPCLRCPLPLLLLRRSPHLLLRGLSDCCPSLLLYRLPVLLCRSLKGQHGSKETKLSAKVAKKYAPAQGDNKFVLQGSARGCLKNLRGGIGLLGLCRRSIGLRPLVRTRARMTICIVRVISLLSSSILVRRCRSGNSCHPLPFSTISLYCTLYYFEKNNCFYFFFCQIAIITNKNGSGGL